MAIEISENKQLGTYYWDIVSKYNTRPMETQYGDATGIIYCITSMFSFIWLVSFFLLANDMWIIPHSHEYILCFMSIHALIWYSFYCIFSSLTISRHVSFMPANFVLIWWYLFDALSVICTANNWGGQNHIFIIVMFTYYCVT